MAYTVKKVDINGKTITSFTNWKRKNPDTLYFDSKIEYEAWHYLEQEGYDIVVEPKINLAAGVETTEYVMGKSRMSNSKTKGNGEIKYINQPAIGFKPDFYLKDKNTYIEVKGFSGDTEAFRLRWKLFKALGYIGYIVYSMKDLKSVLSKL